MNPGCRNPTFTPANGGGELSLFSHFSGNAAHFSAGALGFDGVFYIKEDPNAPSPIIESELLSDPALYTFAINLFFPTCSSPSTVPSLAPSSAPSSVPSATPSLVPSSFPTAAPSEETPELCPKNVTYGEVYYAQSSLGCLYIQVGTGGRIEGDTSDPTCMNTFFQTDVFLGQYIENNDGVISYGPVAPFPYSGNLTIFSYSQGLLPGDFILNSYNDTTFIYDMDILMPMCAGNMRSTPGGD